MVKFTIAMSLPAGTMTKLLSGWTIVRFSMRQRSRFRPGGLLRWFDRLYSRSWTTSDPLPPARTFAGAGVILRWVAYPLGSVGVRA